MSATTYVVIVMRDKDGMPVIHWSTPPRTASSVEASDGLG